MKRKAKPSGTRPTASPTTVKTYVPSPTVAGHREFVSRVVDTVEHMWRRGQVSRRQHKAAETFRGAWDVLYGSIGGSMDMDRVRGHGALHPPPQQYLAAADRIAEAKQALYARDFRVVTLVAGEGRSVEETSRMIFGDRPTRFQKEETGRCLRQGLDELANQWQSETTGRERNIVGYREFDAGQDVETSETVSPSRVAHASGRRVSYSGK